MESFVNKETNRREFVKTAGLAGAGILFASTTSTLLTGCASITYVSQATRIPKDAYTIVNNYVDVELAKVPDLSSVGGSATIEDSDLDNYLLIVRASQDDYVIVSSECTHRGKALGYDHENSRFQCSSLGSSKFKLDGTIIEGPTEKPLKVYNSFISQGLLIIEVR